jgi:hypothetical protein
MRLTTHGLDDAAGYVRAIAKRAEDTREVTDAFERQVMDKRIPQMFRNQGRVPGRWGAGSRQWDPNTGWVRRAKGRHLRVMHGRSNRTSSIADSYRFETHHAPGYAGATKIEWRLYNRAEHAKYLQTGSGMRVVYPRHAKALKIPLQHGGPEPGRKWHAKLIGGTWFIFRKYVIVGPTPPRKILGFFEGDLDWLVFWWPRYIIDGDK